MELFSDIVYSGDPSRTLDLHVPVRDCALPPLLVFVHGGAWRSEDKADHVELARSLAASTRFPVAVPNYTLTFRDLFGHVHFPHPAHAQDVLQALIFLRSWQGPPSIGSVYDPDSLYLIGHSCSAHILSSIFLDSSSVTPSLVPPISLAHAVKGLIMSEGIYDLDLLLTSFPDYRQLFVAPTFGHQDSYASFSPTNFPLVHRHLRWLLIHSEADNLIDLPQSQAMHEHLSRLYTPNAEKHVYSNFHELHAGHDVILGTDKYIRIVTDFVINNT